MVTPEERQEIIDAAVEKALLLLPTVVGNLIVNQTALSKLTSEFYKEHPDFRDNKDAVRFVVEMLEGQSPGRSYTDILRDAVPKIQERIRVTKDLDTSSITTTPDRRLPVFEPLPTTGPSHGEI